MCTMDLSIKICMEGEGLITVLYISAFEFQIQKKKKKKRDSNNATLEADSVVNEKQHISIKKKKNEKQHIYIGI